MRGSGILLHISSLPSPYGIGTLGKAAYAFADFLEAAGQRYWQILPIGPTGYGDSPYQTVSVHAGNPYWIDLELLVQEGFLLQEELEALPKVTDGEKVDYGYLYETRFPLLYQAYRRGWDACGEALRSFREENPWVEDYGLFMALKRSRNMESWSTWPEEIRLRRQGVCQSYATVLAEDMNFFIFLQFLFFRQWDRLRAYLKEKKIQLIGDIPIYVPYDSCDVWAAPELFQLDAEGLPRAVAGCPPDYFSEDGQLWGNPLYDWEAMERENFAWWKARIATAEKHFDVVRIDHFRGLESYWSVPYGEETAKNGRWVKGPGEKLLRGLGENFPGLRFIAEDLGFLTPEVHRLREASGYPGMKILQFAFDPREPSNYLPHRYDRNSVCYIGTHDNETLLQWVEGLDEETLDYTMDYLGIEEKSQLPQGLIRAGMASISDTFILQMQDCLGLGAEGRMNTPGSNTDNWTWRMKAEALTPELAKKLCHLTKLYER